LNREIDAQLRIILHHCTTNPDQGKPPLDPLDKLKGKEPQLIGYRLGTIVENLPSLSQYCPWGKGNSKKPKSSGPNIFNQPSS